MAGSESRPEVLSNLEWKISDKWQALQPATFSTYLDYHITADSGGALRIWDQRQPADS
jgi:Rps23 Pro-64 3,4-dihydroxylase Tpa1-like proline 4-hydroxylase